jgi:PAS domain S-box-containing protein
MKESIILALLQNTSILLAFAMLYENIWIKDNQERSLLTKIIIGFVLSGIGVVIIFSTWEWVPGIVFDTRSVMISIAGLFFGTIPTVILIVVTALVRFFMGGGGQWMGIAVIISSGTIGLLWRYLRPNWKEGKYKWELLAMGITVHVAMACCAFLLPPEKIWITLEKISIPLAFVYTPATLLLGILMINQYKNAENRQAQLRLKESEKRFMQILESGNIVSIILKPNGAIKYCNNYLLEITGYTYEEVMDKNWFNLFIPPELKADLYEMFLINNNTEQFINNNQYQILTKSGEKLYFSWYNTFLISDSNESSGIASIGVNITESKNYEKTLRDKNRKIAVQNEEYKLINKKLQEAKEKAEESERLKSAFLANMSHEIRTPMNGILGFADLLREQNLSGQEQEQYLNIIEKSGRRMLNIINDIISISKIEAGLMTLSVQESNINTQLNYIYTFFTPEVAQKNLQFTYHSDVSDERATIYTDKEKVYAILTNLVKNAIKYTESGFIEFGVKDKTDFFEFYVKDSGIGIPKDKQKDIFERFIQTERMDQTINQGAGLGLSITKAYVEMMGGTISVESTLGSGSCFTFTLPREIKNQPTPHLEINIKENKNSSEFVSNKTAKIIVAEDDDSSLKYLSLILKKRGYEVYSVSSGAEAVELINQIKDIDIALLDIQMPIMDGYEASKLIRSLNNSITIIAQTAFVQENDKTQMLHQYFDDYLSKPVKPSDLFEMIDKYLSPKC